MAACAWPWRSAGVAQVKRNQPQAPSTSKPAPAAEMRVPPLRQVMGHLPFPGGANRPREAGSGSRRVSQVERLLKAGGRCESCFLTNRRKWTGKQKVRPFEKQFWRKLNLDEDMV